MGRNGNSPAMIATHHEAMAAQSGVLCVNESASQKSVKADAVAPKDGQLLWLIENRIDVSFIRLSGGILTSADAAALRTVIPHLHHAHLPGAGHSIRRDKFVAYRDVVQAFLDEPSC